MQSKDSFELPSIFLQRYIYMLTADAFCTLLRFYKFYLEKVDEKEISMPYSIFKKQILVSDDNTLTESIWGELSYWELFRRYYKQNLYILNIGKIQSDNGDDNKKNSYFSIKISGDKSTIKRKQNVKIYVAKYIEGILGRCSNKRIQEKLKKLIDGNVEYFNKKSQKIELEKISQLVEPLLEAKDVLLERVCDIYNNDTKLYASRHPNYILGILKNLRQEDEKQIESKNKSSDFKSKNLDMYNDEKEKSNRVLAIKIATGKIENNTAYKSYLELKDYDGLKQLYDLGVRMLKHEKRNSEIFKDYDWLKDDK